MCVERRGGGDIRVVVMAKYRACDVEAARGRREVCHPDSACRAQSIPSFGQYWRCKGRKKKDLHANETELKRGLGQLLARVNCLHRQIVALPFHVICFFSSFHNACPHPYCTHCTVACVFASRVIRPERHTPTPAEGGDEASLLAYVDDAVTSDCFPRLFRWLAAQTGSEGDLGSGPSLLTEKRVVVKE